MKTVIEVASRKLDCVRVVNDSRERIGGRRLVVTHFQAGEVGSAS